MGGVSTLRLLTLPSNIFKIFFFLSGILSMKHFKEHISGDAC